MCETGQESAWCLCVRQVSVVFVCDRSVVSMVCVAGQRSAWCVWQVRGQRGLCVTGQGSACGVCV